MTSNLVRPSTRHPIIDLTDLDDGAEKRNLRWYKAEVDRYLKQIAGLQSQVTGLQTEVLDLKADLEHTQVDLKYAREKLKSVGASRTQFSEPSNRLSKRPRSPSIEPIGPPVVKKKKAKVKAEPPMSPSKPKLEMYVNVPTLDWKAKIEKESPKKMTISYDDLVPEQSTSGQSDIGYVEKHLQDGSVVQDSQSSVGDSLSMSRMTTPDIRTGQPGQLAPPSFSKRPTSTHVVRSTGRKVHKKVAVDHTNSAAPVGSQPTPGIVTRPAPPVARALLNARYGGSMYTMIQRIDGAHNPSASEQRQLIFPDFEHNPYLPMEPCAPGLVYASREDLLGKPFSLFVRCTRSKNRVWKYFGEYATHRSGTMSTAKFRSLSDKVQGSWAKRIYTAKSKSSEEYVAMRVRIALRKAGVMPSEVVMNELVRKEMKTKPSIQQPDILKAMLEGEEHIGIVNMTCISYDQVFAEDIRETAKKPGSIKLIQRFVKPQSGSSFTATNAESKKSKGPDEQGATVRSHYKTRNQIDDFTEDDARSSSGPFDSASDRQLRPRKPAQHEQSDFDPESEEEDEDYAEEADSDAHIDE